MRRLSLVVLLFLATSSFASNVFVVTNVNDSGPGSLRQALLDLPGCSRPCLVAFDIAGTPPSGYWTIEPLTPLPGVGGAQITIDGHTQRMAHGDTNPAGPEIVLSGASAGPAVGLDMRAHHYTVRGLGFENWQYAAISTTGSLGIYLQPVRIPGITIVDNYFGLDAQGQNPAPNARAMNLGIVEDVTIANNVISGNDLGIAVTLGRRVNIARNNIGLNAARTMTVGNTTVGIRLNAVEEARVERNVIAGHQTAVAIEGSASRTNAIHRNQMHDNVFGIDLQNDGPTPNDSADTDAGPNGLQNHPVLKMSGRTLRGELDSTPGRDFDVDIYETNQPGANQGRRYLGTVTVTTDQNGLSKFSFIVPAGSGPYFTATAMSDVEQSTSEFSVPVN